MVNNSETAPHDVAPTAEVREKPESKEAADAGYSSAEQARAATELAKMYQAHKKIDTELAGRAREMLKTMVDSGGDLDLEAVHAIVNEAQRRYDEADAEVVKAEGTLDGAPDETTFFKVEPKEAGNEGTSEEKKKHAENVLDRMRAATSLGDKRALKAELRDAITAYNDAATAEKPRGWDVQDLIKADDEDDDVTETTAKRVVPVAQKFVPPPLPTLAPREASGSDIFAGPAPSEHAPRIVADTSSQENGPVSVERQTLMQQRQEVAKMVDVNIVKLRMVDRLSTEQALKLKQNQKDAYALLAKIDERLKAA